MIRRSPIPYTWFERVNGTAMCDRCGVPNRVWCERDDEGVTVRVCESCALSMAEGGVLPSGEAFWFRSTQAARWRRGRPRVIRERPLARVV